MNLSEPFIKRPVMTTLVMLSISIFGIVSYKYLPVSALPSVDYPTIQVSVGNPGAQPETMANTCAVPLEREFMTIDGLQTITSSSVNSSSSIVMQFQLNKSLIDAASDVQAAINRALPELPSTLPSNPSYRKVNPAETPILYIAMLSESMTLSDLYNYGNTVIGQRLAMIDGVSQVQTFGAPYAVRIQVDPEKLAALGIGIDQVGEAVRAGNVDMPGGTLYGLQDEFFVNPSGQLMDAKGYNNLSVKTKDGAIVKIQQIGKAIDSLQNDKYYLNYLSKTKDLPCVLLAISKQPGTNTVQIVNSIKDEIPKLQKILPKSLNLKVIFDQSVSIKEGVKEAQFTLLLAYFLVVVVISFALKKFANIIIPSITLPIIMFGTFGAMYLFGFSLDILSLLALTLSIGFLIDDAIVVIENNVRHAQMGKGRVEASLIGSKEIAPTILSMTLSLAAVFIPLIFMGGILGRLFREFSITIVVAVILSGLISLMLTPMLCSKFMPKYEEHKKGKIEIFIHDFYEKMLHWSLAHKKIILSIGGASIVGTYILLKLLPTGFLPEHDWSFFSSFTESKQGTSPHQMKIYQEKIGKIVSKDEAVDSIISVCSTGTDNEGFMFIKLKPYGKRGPIDPIIGRLMYKSRDVIGLNTYIMSPPLVSLQTGIGGKALYQYTLMSLDFNKLGKYSQEMLFKMKELEGFSQVSSDLKINQPQVNIEFNREKASMYNITVAKIEDSIARAFSEAKVSTINSPINQYDVKVETLPAYYQDPTVLNKLYIQSSTNKLVPLSELATMTRTVGPQNVNHLNALPAVTLSFNLVNKSLGDALNELDTIAAEVLPPDIAGVMQGTADVFKSSLKTFPILFILAILAIYVILGILYENFIHPLTVLSALPPAVFGCFLSLFIFQEVFNLYAFVGLIMLIGIVKKNGIMMVDVANIKVTEEKKSAYDAIVEAALLRLRPILMTSIAAIMGALPIAIGIGAASHSRRGLGIAVVGGLVVSQLFTLLLTPVLYICFENLREKISNRWNKNKSNVED
jgi:hydrophobic/amphiphilic exporter-1 (mainly G- bacteria), HAE1 family